MSKCWKMGFFMKGFIDLGLKIGIEKFPKYFIMIYEYKKYKKSRSFFDLDPGPSYFEDLKHLVKRHWTNYNQMSYRASWGRGNKKLSFKLVRLK